MQPIPYLFFNGDCAEALDFYAGILEGRVTETMRASDMPEDFPVPEGKERWLMHAALKVGEGTIMASDNIMGTSDRMAGASVLLTYPTRDEACRIFDALAEGGSVTMPFEPTFWSAGFGTLTDRFGVHWMVGCSEAP